MTTTTANEMAQREPAPRDRQLGAWALLAVELGYSPKPVTLGIDASADIHHTIFDHGLVARRDDGVLVLVGDAYRSPLQDDALHLFAAQHGMRVDHIGPGLWHERTRLVIMSVADPLKALMLLLPRSALWPAQTFIRVAAPAKFLPRGHDMKALRKALKAQAAAESRRAAILYLQALGLPEVMALRQVKVRAPGPVLRHLGLRAAGGVWMRQFEGFSLSVGAGARSSVWLDFRTQSASAAMTGSHPNALRAQDALRSHHATLGEVAEMHHGAMDMILLGITPSQAVEAARAVVEACS